MTDSVKQVFWNGSESRLRSGWRLVLTWLVMTVLFLPVQALLKPHLPESWSRNQKIDLLLVFFAVIATLVIWLTRTRVDKRSFTSLGLSTRGHVVRDIVAGYAISALLVGLVLAVEVVAGWLTFEIGALDWQTAATKFLYLFVVTGLVVAWWENLYFVGYMFLNLRDGCGFWWAFVVTCVIFGLVHGLNPNATVWAVAGVMLIHSYEIFGFLRTRSLWLILGLHAGWNAFQGLAGFAVSGQVGIQWITQKNLTPVWLGGGEFGPEAGLIVVLVALAAFGLIFLYSKVTELEPNHERAAPRRVSLR